ncbi:MAG TPA: hypothetical protein VHM90_00160, partial [Phycisphaerae bacterium]|nr:hypothetical protein [Phycisphaerae bacterium]
ASRSDLLDRSICITLPSISEMDRLTEREFWRKFEKARPRILGAIMDAVTCALKHQEGLCLKRKSRMADFLVFTSAAEPALGLAPGSIAEAYERNRSSTNSLAIEASPVALPLIELISKKGKFEGTAMALLSRLSLVAGEEQGGRVDWPRNPKGMAGALRRIAPNLRARGIDVEFLGKTGSAGARLIRITKSGNQPPLWPVPPVTETKG